MILPALRLTPLVPAIGGGESTVRSCDADEGASDSSDESSSSTVPSLRLSATKALRFLTPFFFAFLGLAVLELDLTFGAAALVAFPAAVGRSCAAALLLFRLLRFFGVSASLGAGRFFAADAGWRTKLSRVGVRAVAGVFGECAILGALSSIASVAFRPDLDARVYRRRVWRTASCEMSTSGMRGRKAGNGKVM